MSDDYIQTVVLDQKKVRQEIVDVDRRVTAQALATATQGATIAALDRSVGAIVQHQVDAIAQWRATKSGIDVIFAQQQIQQSEQKQDLVLRQESHTEILKALRAVRRAILAVGVVMLIGLVIAVAVLAWLR
jgi:hypothetical protein